MGFVNSKNLSLVVQKLGEEAGFAGRCARKLGRVCVMEAVEASISWM